MSISLAELRSFGDVAAEDDAVLDYFLKTEAVNSIQSIEKFLVLGRKGSGKTALVRYFVEGGSSTTSKSLNLRGYPWNVHAQRIDSGVSDIEAYVSSWRYLIAVELAALALSASGNEGQRHQKAKAIRKFLNDNYGGVTPELGDILRPPKLSLSSLSFEPEILGNKIGGIALERKSSDLRLGQELNALSDLLITAVMEVAANAGLSTLLLHFDELDQGLSSMTDERTKMLIGLVLAARTVRQFCRGSKILISPIIYLRTDLWDELKFSDKNKISETLALHLEWDSRALLDLVNTRLSARLPAGASWGSITTEDLMRGSQTKWNHVLARTFLRPRDVIKYLNSALTEAKKRGGEPLLLTNQDITSARDQYSSYLKSELDDEIIAHWPQWEEALQACSAIRTIKFQRDQFAEEYEHRRSSANGIGPDEALKFLYRFSVIAYDRRSGYGGSSWAFQYTNPEAGWDNSSSTFKVHLGLKEFAKLREERA